MEFGEKSLSLGVDKLEDVAGMAKGVTVSHLGKMKRTLLDQGYVAPNERSTATLSSETLRYLEQTTLFSREEILQLFSYFQEVSPVAQEVAVSKTEFSRLFLDDESEKYSHGKQLRELLCCFFGFGADLSVLPIPKSSVLATQQVDTMPFTHFMSIYSHATRGTLDDKVNLVFYNLLMDTNGGLCVSTAKTILPLLSGCLYNMGYQRGYGSLQAILSHTFHNLNETQFIHIREFHDRCVVGLLKCFGLFDFLELDQALKLSPGEKTVEGSLKKKSELRGQWNERWVIVTHGVLAYYRNANHAAPDHVFNLIDAKVEADYAAETAFRVSTPQYSATFQCNSADDLQKWVDVVRSQSRTCSGSSNFRFNSYAPVRSGCTAEWLVDGRSTYKSIFTAIQQAAKEIFITDWFLSPEVSLIRDNPPLKEEDTLHYILHQKAEQGVRVFIIVWNETKIAVGLNSSHAKSVLESHKNIHVIRHPFSQPLEWSHHQKTVVCDQRVAFVGGLDLCFGRFDDHTHSVCLPLFELAKLGNS